MCGDEQKGTDSASRRSIRKGGCPKRQQKVSTHVLRRSVEKPLEQAIARQTRPKQAGGCRHSPEEGSTVCRDLLQGQGNRGFDAERAGVDHHRILSRFQRGLGAVHVALVPFLHIRQNLLQRNRLALGR